MKASPTSAPVDNILGRRLREMRDKAEMSQRTAAEKVNINVATMLNYETGKRVPDAYVLKCFSVLYGCSADYLLGLSDSISENPPKAQNSLNNELLSHFPKLSPATEGELYDALERFLFQSAKFHKKAFLLPAEDSSDHIFFKVRNIIRAFNTYLDGLSYLIDKKRNDKNENALFNTRDIFLMVEQGNETRRLFDELVAYLYGCAKDEINNTKKRSSN